MDNIVKPVLDALKGIVYDDDASIGQCLVTAVDTSHAYEIPSTNIDRAVYDELIAALGDAEHVLYVEVGSADSVGVVFGPIDGGDT